MQKMKEKSWAVSKEYKEYEERWWRIAVSKEYQESTNSKKKEKLQENWQFL